MFLIFKAFILLLARCCSAVLVVNKRCSKPFRSYIAEYSDGLRLCCWFCSSRLFSRAIWVFSPRYRAASRSRRQQLLVPRSEFCDIELSTFSRPSAAYAALSLKYRYLLSVLLSFLVPSLSHSADVSL